MLDSCEAETDCLINRFDFLAGGGKMANAILTKDWSTTAVGAIESWPQSLRTTVSLCLASNFPMSIAWGRDRVQIYNDGYWPICGAKHPHSMGQDFKECWFSAWPQIGEAFERAQSGASSYIENQRMFLDRNGYLEETFFTFSFSPIRDETGGVGGLFHPVTETTARMLSERRTRTLRDVATRTTNAKSMAEACRIATQVLAQYPLDLPFIILYVFDEGVTRARLAGTTGIEPNAKVSPVLVDLQRPVGQWPLLQPIQSVNALLVDDFGNRFHLSCAPYPECLKRAFILPIPRPGMKQPVGFAIAGVSPRLALDEAYRDFFDLLASHLAAALANARGYEGERRRAEALAEVDRAKTAFFNNVSHEFRTPLTLILGPLEEMLSRAEFRVTATREDLDLIHRNTKRLLKLVNALLEFSRIEAGRVLAACEPTDLASLTRDVASIFRSTIERAGLGFVVDCPPLSELVYVDPEMWEKIVVNLISNALKFTFRGEIQVSLRDLGDMVELSVRDTGTGIPASELQHIFDRFHRVQGARGRTYEGTGIGLALVRELLTLHGGSVRAESVIGQGSTFSVLLRYGSAHLGEQSIAKETKGGPKSTTAAAFMEEAVGWTSAPRPCVFGLGEAAFDSKQGSGAQRQETSRARVLLADDNADMRDYLCRVLENRFDVEAVANGEAALRAAEEYVPSLVLSDVMMPALDGFGLLRALRDNPRTATVPVILLSARAGEESRVEGLEAGADDYLIKPFSARELLARVTGNIELARLRRELVSKEEQWRTEVQKTLHAKNLELERASRAKDQFLASMSHELRTPLNAILGFTGTLLMKFPGPLTSEQERQLRTVQTSGKHLLSLINDLLDLAKIESGKIELGQELLNCREVLHEIVSSVQPIAESKGISLSIDAAPGELMVQTDRGALHQILLNLTNNAIKFTEKGAVRLQLRKEALDRHSLVEFSVIDTGVGIRPEDQGKLFEAFSQVNSPSNGRCEGTGLGLHLSRKLAELLSGQITFESEFGKGSTFRLTLAGG
jgi:signal transduction histidine kinase